MWFSFCFSPYELSFSSLEFFGLISFIHFRNYSLNVSSSVFFLPHSLYSLLLELQLYKLLGCFHVPVSLVQCVLYYESHFCNLSALNPSTMTYIKYYIYMIFELQNIHLIFRGAKLRIVSFILCTPSSFFEHMNHSSFKAVVC